MKQMEDILETAEKDYITRWSVNAKQHFDDGDYEWICDLINKIPTKQACRRILEIGCGAGYSTLTFILRDFDVLAIDTNEEAIQATKTLIEIYECDAQIIEQESNRFTDADAILWKIDLIHEFGRIRKAISDNNQIFVDLIVLCNPGGQIDAEITELEYKYLKWGDFTEDEIIDYYQNGHIELLHKWAMIYAACGLAKLTDKQLLIVDRGTKDGVKSTLSQIQSDTGNRIVRQAYRPIKNAPKDGVQLGSVEEDSQGQQFWGAGLYYPQ